MAKTKFVGPNVDSCEKNLINNWYDELKKHTFIIPVKLGNKVQENTTTFLSGSNVMILNYEIINNEFDRIKTLCSSRKVGIVLDESAKIKNPKSKLSKDFHKLSVSFKKNYNDWYSICQ